MMYSDIIDEFQDRVRLFDDFWGFWEKNKPKKYLPGEEYDRYCELQRKHEKESGNVITFNFSVGKDNTRKNVCRSQGEFIIGLFLEKLGLSFETQVRKNDLIKDEDRIKYDEFTKLPPFDFYIKIFKLLLEVDGARYHIFSLCTNPELCASSEIIPEKRRPPEPNVEKHIDDYYGKADFARMAGFLLLRIISRNILYVKEKKTVLKYDSFYHFVNNLKPIVEESSIPEKESIIENIRRICIDYYKEVASREEYGEICKIDNAKRYGYIKPSDYRAVKNSDIYFIYNDLKFNLLDISVGLKVKYEIGKNKIGICAKKVMKKHD